VGSFLISRLWGEHWPEDDMEAEPIRGADGGTVLRGAGRVSLFREE